MTALADAVRFAHDPQARELVKAAMCAAAVAIVYEDPETAQHTARADLAARVLRDPESTVASFVWACTTNATLVGEWVTNNIDGATGDLAFVISSVWNAVAGVPAS